MVGVSLAVAVRSAIVAARVPVAVKKVLPFCLSWMALAEKNILH